MSSITPISGGPRPVINESTDRNARGRDIASGARDISEVSNGERNATATANEARKLSQAASRQVGIGGALDITG